MVATMLVSLGLISVPAHAEPQMVQYDSYEDDGQHLQALLEEDGWPGYFANEDYAFGKYNCMAMVYSFTEDQFPLNPTGLQVFWAGEGVGETKEAMMRLKVYWYEADADAAVMATGTRARLLEEERFRLDGIEKDSWYEIDFETKGISIDFDEAIEGDQPIDYGSLVMSLCYVNAQTFPEVAMDNNGYDPEPDPESGDAPLEGHETSSFRSMIYWNGIWYSLHDYLMGVYGFDGSGDFVMRLLIDANVDEDVDDVPGCRADEAWAPTAINPSKTTEGTRQTVLISGDYNFPDDVQVSLGDVPMLAVDVNSSCGINAAVDPNMRPGTYDVNVQSGSDLGTIEDGFTVEKEKGGCATADNRVHDLVWVLPLMGLALVTRRRD